MSCLLYCIFHSSKSREPGNLPGIGGQPVFVISKNGLGAAVTHMVDRRVAPDISHILAYEEVVEVFHRDRTVIPMRYGNIFN